MSAEKELHRAAPDRPNRETVQSTMPKLHLTSEELRVLEECNKESFFYRSVPLATVAMIATQLAVKRGLLKPHPRWGSSLKLLGAGFVAWFVGKFSYQSACEEKFLRLKNSPVADMIRKKKGITSQPFEEHSPSEEILFGDDTTYSIDDDFVSSSRSLNLDTDKNIQYAGLDDSDRFRDDYSTQSENKPPKFSTTYEELRKKNREEYEMRQSKLFAPSTPSYMPPLTSSSKDWKSHEDKPPGSGQSSYQSENVSVLQNIYGDRWDK